MIDTGARLGEVTGLQVDDVQPKAQETVGHGRGDRSRRVYFSATTAVELDRYRRIRARRSWSTSPALWVGAKGPLTDSGITQVLRRRASAAGIKHIHPHMLRHTWAHLMKVGGMPDDEVMQLGGWRTAQMLTRYGASATSERARTTYDRKSWGSARASDALFGFGAPQSLHATQGDSPRTSGRLVARGGDGCCLPGCSGPLRSLVVAQARTG